MKAKTTKVKQTSGTAISKEDYIKLVQEKARQLWLERGKPAGKDLDNWLDAEKIVKKENSLC